MVSKGVLRSASKPAYKRTVVEVAELYFIVIGCTPEGLNLIRRVVKALRTSDILPLLFLHG